MKLFPGVKHLKIVQGPAQVTGLHGKVWRGTSGSRAFLFCTAGAQTFCSAKAVWAVGEVSVKIY